MYNNGGSARFYPIHTVSTEDFDYCMKNELYNVFFGYNTHFCKILLVEPLDIFRSVLESNVGMKKFDPDVFNSIVKKVWLVDLMKMVNQIRIN
ncbi:hypothetical protein [Pectinatus frisingensis]|uniref:hypothetical protein n=1 Tax=Pectinatus frisingensis TaxID=865 RepID=UPI0018C74ECD